MSAVQMGVTPPGVTYVMSEVHKRQRDFLATECVATQVSHHLQRKLDLNSASFLSEAKFHFVGSAAENLVTSISDDRDLLLVLGPPYTLQYFKAVHEGHGRYFMKWNKCKWNGTKPRYVNDENYLSATSLRNHVTSCVRSSLEGATISEKKVVKILVWKQAVRVILKDEYDGTKHIVDVIPQIMGGKWSTVDGLVSLGSLEPELQKLITEIEAAGNSAILYSLFGAAGTSLHTFTTNYSILEREFFLKNHGLREVVMLAKLILSGHHWKDKYGIKAAHLKRVALGNITTLGQLNPWQGMQHLFHLMVSQLQTGYLDGFPDLHCDLLWHKTEEDCQYLAKAIMNVMMTLDPKFLANYL
ncbi:uncharacterized protein LOC121866502 [Homarus americanus]|uniref:Putative Mab-21 protein domain-containing protein 1 n=1 Tax=Homarus americanus TaxID=6706 RepID=A0A8J5K7H6_HOMAM|nr:uncharacterized protein LOC121866502 [Homarus americanus]XP_042222173.1 uncharacterized protein LOC121866502 [Homarus americanus]KAG7169031.1 putative Mab-21 protein domain-containing protein 1 [Homarus americanus]